LEGRRAVGGGHVHVGPEVREPREEEGLQEREPEGRVEEEAQEVRECGVADAVVGPGAMVIHFGYAS